MNFYKLLTALVIVSVASAQQLCFLFNYAKKHSNSKNLDYATMQMYTLPARDSQPSDGTYHSKIYAFNWTFLNIHGANVGLSEWVISVGLKNCAFVTNVWFPAEQIDRLKFADEPNNVYTNRVCGPCINDNLNLEDVMATVIGTEPNTITVKTMKPSMGVYEEYVQKYELLYKNA